MKVTLLFKVWYSPSQMSYNTKCLEQSFIATHPLVGWIRGKNKKLKDVFVKFICAAIQIWTRILLSQSPSIMQSWEPRPSAPGSPLRLSSGWDVLSMLESQISSSHLNHRATLHLINDLHRVGGLGWIHDDQGSQHRFVAEALGI